MSTVFYRWGAGRDESRVTFDGTHISVFDLKREIILGNKMGNGKDFDIGIYDNVTGEEFKDDNHQIPRSSSLIARRLPSSIKGRGNAQNYIVGTAAADALTGDHRIESHARDAMQAKLNKGVRGVGGTFGSMTRRFDGKEEKKPGESSMPITTGDADEDAKIQAMFAQNAENWEQMQEDMSLQYRAPAARAARATKPSSSAVAGAKYDFSLPADKEPPVGYICYRCGQKGHWIQNCPANEDPAAQNQKRFVRVTGIPRSFLKTVEVPLGGEGSSGGAMLTADGGFVRAVPDQRQWQKQAAVKPRALTGADVRDQEPLDAALTCQICKKLVWEAVRVPCCDTSYCEECIQTYLVDHDFECPSCESKIQSFDKLKPDEELREKVKSYVDGEVERSKEESKDEPHEDGEGEGEKGQDDSEEGAVTPNGNEQETKPNSNPPQIMGPNGQPLNPELLNPQVINTYLMGAKKMLLNPSLIPQARATLLSQIQVLQANLLQMQMLASNGMNVNMNMNMNNPMNMNVNQGMDLGMNMGMGLGMNMGMDMSQNQNNMGMGMGGGGLGMQNGFGGGGAGFHGHGQGQGQGQGMRGRAGFRGGGFRGGGRGGFQNNQRAPIPSGQGFRQPGFGGVKRGPDELGSEQFDGEGKQQKVM